MHGVAATLVVAAAGGLRDAHAQTAQADVALVLAVDVSGSVDDICFKLEGEATAAALLRRSRAMSSPRSPPMLTA